MNFRDTETVVLKGTHKRPSVMVAIPTLGMVSINFHIAAQRLQMPTNAHVESMVVINKEIGEARNEIAKYYMSRPADSRPEFLFMLGDDMVPNSLVFIKLWEDMRNSDYDVMSGLYFFKSETIIPILWRTSIDGHLQEGVHYKMGDIVDSDIAGMDFTLIRPSAFERIKEPYFKTGPSLTADSLGNPTGGIWCHTEDAYFCRKVIDAGGKVAVHTGCRIGHYNNFDGGVY